MNEYGTSNHSTRGLQLSRRIYRLLLRAYPTEFWQAHGAELLQVFCTSLREEYRLRGRAGVARLWLLTIFDVAINALALHLAGLLKVWRGRQRGMAQASEHIKRKRTFGEMIESVWQDLRYGVRTLARTPSFTAVAMLALALGISANSILFSVVNTVLLRPLPYRDAERLALIWTRFEPELPECGVSGPEVIDFRERSKSFESIAALEWRTFGLTGSGEPEQLQGAVVSPNVFSLLGVTPALGRSFLPQEGPSSEGRAVVLSHGLWQRRFGSAPNLVGQSILLDGQAHTVIGVMPAEFALLPPTRNSPNRIDLWVRQPVEYQRLSRGNHSLYVMARLKPDVTLEQAQADMNAVATQLNNEFYSWGGRGTFTFGITVESYHQRMVGHLRRLLYVLLGAVSFVLLIACVNVANLLLAKAVAREREIAVRAALGASRWRIIRQLLTESFVLALCSGAAGLVFTDLGLQALSKLAPDSVPRLAEVTIDGRVFGFTLAISFLTGLVFGLVPAFQAAKLSLNESLKEGSHSSSGGLRGRRVRSALVVVEVALALVLMAGAGLMLRSFARLQQVDRGFNPNQLLTAQLQLPRAKYPGGPNVTTFYQQLEERVRALPGIESVGMVSGLPLGGFYDNSTIAVENTQQNQRIGTLQGDVRASSPDYFKTLRIPLLKGRVFTDHDSADSPKVVIIDDVFAKRFFANVDPIGKRVNLMADLHAGKPWASIVGVVSHVKDTIDARETGQLYIPQTQQPSPTMFLAVRAVGEPSVLINAVRNAVWALDPEQPVSNIRTMAERVDNSVAQPRLNTLLLALFAAVALILASIGIYGVMNYAVTQRTHEIGVRMALGARQSDIIKLVVGQGLFLIAVGVLAGLAAAFVLTRVMTTLLFDVSATDPLTFAGVSIVLVTIALLASFVPARKATKVDPMSAMRYE
jgi:putative ABC transport system permease protein